MSKDCRSSFVFYRSFHEAIQDLPDSDKLIIYEAITQYALDRTEPDLSGFSKTIFKLIRPQIDANWKRYENGKKGAEHGTKGGAPIGNKNANGHKTTPKQPQDNGKTTPNVNDNVNDNDKYTDDFDLFFEQYHSITGIKKSDRESAFKHWQKLLKSEKSKAIDSIQSYFNSLSDPKYCKKARTYLSDKNFNDEFQSSQSAKTKPLF